MTMTKKFAIFDLNHGGFLAADGSRMEEKDEYDERKDYDLLNGAIFTEETAKEKGIDLEESNYLMVPIPQNVYDSLPIDMEDTAPDVSFGDVDPEARREALKGDFVVLSPEGFYDERYHAGEVTDGEEWSSTKIRGYRLDYANLYDMESLERIGQAGIVAESNNEFQAAIIPVSEIQQDKLKQLPEFSPEREPYGFFMEPIGSQIIREHTESAEVEKEPLSIESDADTLSDDADTLVDLGDALDALEADSQEQGMEQ